MIAELSADLPMVRDRLASHAAEGRPVRHRLASSLALLPAEPGAPGSWSTAAVDPSATPEEVLVIGAVLRAHGPRDGEIVRRLAGLVADPKGDADVRLRAAARWRSSPRRTRAGAIRPGRSRASSPGRVRCGSTPGGVFRPVRAASLGPPSRAARRRRDVRGGRPGLRRAARLGPDTRGPAGAGAHRGPDGGIGAVAAARADRLDGRGWRGGRVVEREVAAPGGRGG